MQLSSKSDDTVLFQVEGLPRPPGSSESADVDVVLPRPRAELPRAVINRKPAVDLLADWLCGYGAGDDVPPLSDGVVKAYLEPQKPVACTRSAVFAGLMATEADKGEVV